MTYDSHRAEFFTDGYRNNLWGSLETRSGQGSERFCCEALIEALPKVFEEYAITSMLDVPCGDFHFMQDVAFPRDFRYLGADIVEDVVVANARAYGSAGRSFQTLDVVVDPLPSVDLIFMRDLLIHMSLEMCLTTLQNVLASDFKYLMLTHDIFIERYKSGENVELEPSHHGVDYTFRPMSMTLKPFCFPPPKTAIVEYSNAWDSGKTMALWTRAEVSGALERSSRVSA